MSETVCLRWFISLHPSFSWERTESAGIFDQSSFFLMLIVMIDVRQNELCTRYKQGQSDRANSNRTMNTTQHQFPCLQFAFPASPENKIGCSLAWLLQFLTVLPRRRLGSTYCIRFSPYCFWDSSECYSHCTKKRINDIQENRTVRTPHQFPTIL